MNIIRQFLESLQEWERDEDQSHNLRCAVISNAREYPVRLWRCRARERTTVLEASMQEIQEGKISGLAKTCEKTWNNLHWPGETFEMRIHQSSEPRTQRKGRVKWPPATGKSHWRGSNEDISNLLTSTLT